MIFGLVLSPCNFIEDSSRRISKKRAITLIEQSLKNIIPYSMPHLFEISGYALADGR